MDYLVAAIRRQLRAKIADMGERSRSLLKPGDPTEFANDERDLGFEFPSLLKRLYSEIGNGGFGPGYGLIGLSKGVPDDLGKTAPEIYRQFRTRDTNWNWPVGLLPICHWGCAILSCIDCADSNFRMRIFDPNAHNGNDWSDAFFEESPDFETWIGAWSKGVNLWDTMYGEGGHIFQILSDRARSR